MWEVGDQMTCSSILPYRRDRIDWLGGCEGNFLSSFQGSQIGQKLNEMTVSVSCVACAHVCSKPG